MTRPAILSSSSATILICLAFFCGFSRVEGAHLFNGAYDGANVSRVAFPLGGIGAGCYFLEGNGGFSGISVKHRLDFFNEPTFFAALCVKGTTSTQNVAKVLEGPIPEYKYFGRPGAALGSGDKTYGLPRFTDCKFEANFPFAEIDLTDDVMPVDVKIIGFSPFIPNEPDWSSMPAGSIDYVLTNKTDRPLDAVFSFNARNFMGGSSFEKLDDGFNVVGPDGKFAVVIQQNAQEKQKVYKDCCWFRGGWFDPLSVVWNNIQQGALIDNPPSEGNAPGASLFTRVELAPKETKNIRVLTAWHIPSSNLKEGQGAQAKLQMATFPAKGTAQRQQNVSGYSGSGLVNTFYPDGDGHVGRLISPTFTPKKKYLYFKIGGGSLQEVGVSIQEEIDGEFKTVATYRGKDLEKLEWTKYSFENARGKNFRLYVFDESTLPWGHINADQFVFSDLEESEFFAKEKEFEGKDATSESDEIVLFADFEQEDFGKWQVVQTVEAPTPQTPRASTYVPWYATRYESVKDVLKTFDSNYDALRARSELFAQTLDKSTLAPEIMEAVEANLAILKTPTVLRQFDGRLWAWEGCQDSNGSCAGSCTHVWNYTQALAHLFPSLERSFRQTEFNESLTSTGRQAFRANLPISHGGISWDASDGQLGTIMRVHREWKISGSDEFLREYWSKVKLSLEFCIATWDPNESGLLTESHHNTYDINYVGIDGHCGSFYLGALAAVCKMGEALGEDVERYRAILKKGCARYEKELFNGEYFVQRIPQATNEETDVYQASRGNVEQSAYYQEVARKMFEQGPKYQYGNGCLSDGVLGFWIAKVCGIDDDLIDPKLIKSHLLAVYKHNFKRDLSACANPQRPTYALGKESGLLLCSWPNDDKLLLPFPYSDEVWTGIEYQVASHLAFFGEYDKARDIVAAARTRYDGAKRNPFDEYECGHFYARAMSSFGLLQGFTGVRYDATNKTLYYRPTSENYVVPLFTNSGYALVRFEASTKKISWELVEGTIDVQKTEPQER